LRSYTIGAIPKHMPHTGQQGLLRGETRLSMVGWMFRDVLQYDISYD
jgi:hypothetical protein